MSKLHDMREAALAFAFVAVGRSPTLVEAHTLRDLIHRANQCKPDGVPDATVDMFREFAAAQPCQVCGAKPGEAHRGGAFCP